MKESLIRLLEHISNETENLKRTKHFSYKVDRKSYLYGYLEMYSLRDSIRKGKKPVRLFDFLTGGMCCFFALFVMWVNSPFKKNTTVFCSPHTDVVFDV